MDNNVLKELRSGFETAYVDCRMASGEIFRPSFVTNNKSEHKKVLSSIDEELLSCEKFQIGVAFITMSGITPLLQTLKELERKGVQGQILTTNYLSFSEPAALEKLHSLTNITIKMFDVEASSEGFHTKGYIFKREGLYRIVIGSSNMTSAALTSNREWNTRIVSTDQGEMARQILEEYNELWNSRYSLEYEDFIEKYSLQYKIIKHQREVAQSQNPVSLVRYKLEPNSMQIGFISNLQQIVERGGRRALLISATGTGKTYAAAFAMRELGYKKVLFVVHRNQIAKQAKESFENVFGDTVKTGLISGSVSNDEGYKADYVFATVQTLSKEKNYQRFPEEYFDCCIFDESHRATADSYKKLFGYFKPGLALGMTATPDKRDDNLEGRNVYELFDHNIACEIRLQQAMEENLLCPFHYFGITDIDIINDDTREKIESAESFRRLTCDERVKNVIQQAEYFGHSGTRVKGLIFCSRNEEAEELSRKFNQLGLKTDALSGNDPEGKRLRDIELLTREFDTNNGVKNENGILVYPNEEYLDYIITVDIFSEGIDIIEVNQVIMLRPTQSPIVFIQQLGRGLRKCTEKEYVVVLDFIGNYKNNFMIPIALSGDRTYNKDNIRHYLGGGGKTIPGESSVHFDEISRKRIYSAIDKANFSAITLIRENYSNLKNKLGRIPNLRDFDEYGEMDVLRIFDNKGSYYNFLVDNEKEYKIRLPEDCAKAIEFVSKKLAAGKRIHELEILRSLMDSYRSGNDIKVFRELAAYLKNQFGKNLGENQKRNLVNVLTNQFPTKSAQETYAYCIFIEPDGEDDYKISTWFREALTNSDFAGMMWELVDFGMGRFVRDYCDTYENTDFVLNKKYTYEDVCRLLNWQRNEVSQNIGGYKFDKTTKTYPVFINYDKSDDINDTIKYQDHFENPRVLKAISKSRRKRSSPDVQNFLYAKEKGIQVELFVRKNKDDNISKEFYYLGHMTASGNADEFVMKNTKNVTAVEIEWILDRPVKEDLYEYITKD